MRAYMTVSSRLHPGRGSARIIGGGGTAGGRRRFIRVRFQPNAGSLGRDKGFGVSGERSATRPSVVGNEALSNDATVAVDTNLALDPVIRDLDNPADRSLGRLRGIQPLGVG